MDERYLRACPADGTPTHTGYIYIEAVDIGVRGRFRAAFIQLGAGVIYSFVQHGLRLLSVLQYGLKNENME